MPRYVVEVTVTNVHSKIVEAPCSDDAAMLALAETDVMDNEQALEPAGYEFERSEWDIEAYRMSGETYPQDEEETNA